MEFFIIVGFCLNTLDDHWFDDDGMIRFKSRISS